MLKKFGLLGLALVFSGVIAFTSIAVAGDAWASGNAWHNTGDKDKGGHKGMGMHHGGGGMGMMMSGEGHMTARLRSVWKLKLTNEQKKGIRKIQGELRSKHWNHADSIDVLSDKLMDLYRKDVRDAKAIGKVYGEIFEKRKQIIMLGIEAGNKVEKLLTKEQREKMKKMSPIHKMGEGW